MKGKVFIPLILVLGVALVAFAEDRQEVLQEEAGSQRVDNPTLDDVVAGFAQRVEAESSSKIILWDEAKKMDFTKRSSKRIRIEINY